MIITADWYDCLWHTGININYKVKIHQKDIDMSNHLTVHFVNCFERLECQGRLCQGRFLLLKSTIKCSQTVCSWIWPT